MLTHSFTYLTEKKTLYVSLFYVHIIIHTIHQVLYDMLCHMDECKVLTYFQAKEFFKERKTETPMQSLLVCLI